MGELLLGCSGWNYGDTSDKGGWVGVFYPDKDTKRLRLLFPVLRILQKWIQFFMRNSILI